MWEIPLWTRVHIKYLCVSAGYDWNCSYITNNKHNVRSLLVVWMQTLIFIRKFIDCGFLMFLFNNVKDRSRNLLGSIRKWSSSAVACTCCRLCKAINNTLLLIPHASTAITVCKMLFFYITDQITSFVILLPESSHCFVKLTFMERDCN